MKKSGSKLGFVKSILCKLWQTSFIVLLLTLIVFESSQAQDTIINKRRETIICTINKVDSLNIHYTRKLHNGESFKTFISIEEVSDYKYGPKSEKANFWFNVGVGGGIVSGGFGPYTADSPGAPSFGFNFSTQKKWGLISLRYVYNQEIIYLKTTPLENVYDIGVLYGRVARTSFGFVSISGGVSYVGGVRRGEFGDLSNYTFHYERLPYSTFGIPIESQLFFTPSPYIGFGVYGFANINPERSFFGGLFCIQLGRLNKNK